MVHGEKSGVRFPSIKHENDLQFQFHHAEHLHCACLLLFVRISAVASLLIVSLSSLTLSIMGGDPQTVNFRFHYSAVNNSTFTYLYSAWQHLNSYTSTPSRWPVRGNERGRSAVQGSGHQEGRQLLHEEAEARQWDSLVASDEVDLLSVHVLVSLSVSMCFRLSCTVWVAPGSLNMCMYYLIYFDQKSYD